MTINSFLQTVHIADQSSRARYPDGSGGGDHYTLIVSMDGHGKLLNAKVQYAKIAGKMLFIQADGEERNNA